MHADVAIVGLGPVGATLAGLLGKRGLRVIAIEKDPQLFPLPRAAHIDHTGLRTIQELGCLDRVLPRMVRNMRLDLLDADRRPLVRVPAGQESISGLPTSAYFYQPELDRALRDNAGAHKNVEMRIGTEMTDIEGDASGVTLTLRASSGVEDVRVAWLVGCDGAWSPVRERMGIKLDSLGFDEKWLVLDLLLKQHHASLPRDHVIEVCDPARPYLTTPISESRQRFEFMLLPGEDPDDIRKPETVAHMLEGWIPQAKYEVERAAIYTFHGLLAQSWRQGRVFIAGDAAHQTPPFLGQGMCTGMRDASNLAWKLAQVISNGAPHALLDTYESERKPHARYVIEAAIRIGRVVCELDEHRAAERNRALRARDASLETELAFALPRLVPGPLVLEGGGGLFIQPHLGNRRLDDVVGQRFLVVGRSKASLGSSADWWSDRMDAMVLDLTAQPTPPVLQWLDRFGADAAVVRPDRYVLGTGKSLDLITSEVRDLLQASAATGTRAIEMPVH